MTVSFWVGLKKSPFLLKLVLQTYQRHFRAYNASSFSIFSIFGFTQHSSVKCFKEQCAQLHIQCHRLFQCELHCAIAFTCSNMNSIAPSPSPMSLGTFYTLPPFVNFFNLILLCMVLQKTTRNNYSLSSSFLCCPRVLICNTPIIWKRWWGAISSSCYVKR